MSINSHRCFVTVIIWATLGLASAAGLVLEVGQARSHPDGDEVVVKGRVKTVSYTPVIRNGRTLLSLVLTDGESDLLVVSPFAAIAAVGDEVVASGKLRSGVNSPLGPELDASTGDLTVSSRAQPSDDSTPKEHPDAPAGVPTVVLETPWSRTVGLASLVSAVSAIIAALLIYYRRFNVGLAIEVRQPLQLEIEEDQRQAHVTLRLLSTGSRVPFIRQEITLAISGHTLTACRVFHSEMDLDFPFAVDRELFIRLRFIVPDGLAAPRGTLAAVAMQEAFSGASFRRELVVSEPLTAAITQTEATVSMAPSS